ncbi:MAG: hypothetical protein WD400_02035 [Pontimonas sp.]
MAHITRVPRKGLQSEAEVLDFAEGSVGLIESHEDISRPGSPHRVSKLRTRAGDDLIAKWCADAPSYFKIFDALGHYAKPLGTSAPRLIDHHDGLKAILMTTLPGAPADALQAQDPVMHYRVGQIIRRFHESAPATHSRDITTQLASTLSRLVDQSEHDLGPLGTAELRTLGMQLLDLGELSLQPLHGYLSPEHWMIDTDYGVQLMSFSKSEYDPWIMDTAVLERDYWAYSPELKSAFFSGYDKTPSEQDGVLLRAKQAMDALTAWVQLGTGRHAKKASRKDRILAWSRVEQATGATLF